MAKSSSSGTDAVVALATLGMSTIASDVTSDDSPPDDEEDNQP